MRSLTRALIALAVVTGAGRGSRAAEPNAAGLAAVIDRHIESRLQADRVPAAEPANDAEFLRRVYLDLHGVVPTAEQAAGFLGDTRSDRRARLIDALLADGRYGEYLADVWQGYLVSPLADDRRARADQFRQWLAGQFNTRTWDGIVTELLTATGKMDENPAVVYLIEGRLPRRTPCIGWNEHGMGPSVSALDASSDSRLMSFRQGFQQRRRIVVRRYGRHHIESSR